MAAPAASAAPATINGIRIAFGCQARVGKDTSALYLSRHLKDVKIVSFAQPLYEIMTYAQKTCGFDLAKDRKFLQWIGTEWARSIDPDIWVKLLISKIKQLDNTSSIIVTDVRFVNEFEALKKEGFTMVRLIRDLCTTDSTIITHASETSATYADLPWDYIINNNSTIENLYMQLDSLIGK
jgi:hypothetical protein